MALDVNVKIKLTSGAGTDGFGVPLILVSHADSAVAYHECATASEVKLAGFAEGSEAYKLFVLMKAQDNAPRLCGGQKRLNLLPRPQRDGRPRSICKARAHDDRRAL